MCGPVGAVCSPGMEDRERVLRLVSRLMLGKVNDRAFRVFHRNSDLSAGLMHPLPGSSDGGHMPVAGYSVV